MSQSAESDWTAFINLRDKLGYASWLFVSASYRDLLDRTLLLSAPFGYSHLVVEASWLLVWKSSWAVFCQVLPAARYEDYY